MLSLFRLGRELRQQCWRARGLVLQEAGMEQDHWRHVVLSCVSARGREAGMDARAHRSRNRKHRDSVLVRRLGPRASEMPSMPRLELGMAQGMSSLRGSNSAMTVGKSSPALRRVDSKISCWAESGTSASGTATLKMASALQRETPSSSSFAVTHCQPCSGPPRGATTRAGCTARTQTQMRSSRDRS